MMDSSDSELLLSNATILGGAKRNKCLFISSAKWVLKIGIWIAFLPWLLIIFLYPLSATSSWIEKWLDTSTQTFLGFIGGAFVLLSGPVTVIALLSVGYLIFNSHEEEHEGAVKRLKKPSYSLWTYPVIIEGPLGIVSAAELIGILLFALYIIWVAAVYAAQKIPTILANADYTTEIKWSWVFRLSARAFGLSAAFCMSFLFIPVARGSVILRVLNIPFAHAIRYHIWIGHLMMLLLTFHGLFYIIGWFLCGEIPSQLILWSAAEPANLAGIINIFFGYSIWITSFPFVRRKNFELFYYTHHLYIIFIIFFAMHVGDFLFNIVAGGIFLFMLDRFLRFSQSRKIVDIISVRSFPSGVVELVLSKPENVEYNALSYLFIQIKEISLLQWHPLSVTSCPEDGKDYVSVLIKVLGDWTLNLRDNIINTSEGNWSLHKSLTASVEGPYGHESPHHLTYENLVLVAGGIGITPFLAILSDVLSRIKKGKPCLPRNIFLVWAVKRSIEISLLSTIELESIAPFPLEMLQIELLIHVTQETEPEQENIVCNKIVTSSFCPISCGNGISALVSTGNQKWNGAYMISSVVGLLVLLSFLNVFYIIPFKITNWWYQGILLLGCMVASVLIFGGTVVGFWHAMEGRNLAKEKHGGFEGKVDVEWSNQQTTRDKDKNLFLENLGSSVSIHYRSRPDIKEIFGSISKNWGEVDVGVTVCGPQSLESSVAKECKSHNRKRQSSEPVFHFHSHSFSL